MFGLSWSDRKCVRDWHDLVGDMFGLPRWLLLIPLSCLQRKQPIDSMDAPPMSHSTHRLSAEEIVNRQYFWVPKVRSFTRKLSDQRICRLRWRKATSSGKALKKWFEELFRKSPLRTCLTSRATLKPLILCGPYPLPYLIFIDPPWFRQLNTWTRKNLAFCKDCSDAKAELTPTTQ